MRIYRIKIKKLTQTEAVLLLIAELFVGTVFTFGMRYWNKTVSREECTVVQTQLVSYHKRKRIKQSKIKEIEIDCSNGQKYLIYNAYINDNLINALSKLSEIESITLLIHPNREQIVEFSGQNGTVMSFDETMHRLKSESYCFFFLGLFMYFCAVMTCCIFIYRPKKR